MADVEDDDGAIDCCNCREDWYLFKYIGCACVVVFLGAKLGG